MLRRRVDEAKLVLECVTFRYGLRRRPLLNDLTLTFDRGLTLLLGPNGAGKSTVLGLASSALTPQRGRVLVEGVDSRRRRAYRAKVSWLPQRPSVVPASTAREQVALAGWLKGMSRPAAWDAAAVALDRVDLGEEANQRARSLSGGQLARVGLAQALVHDSAVVLLDEPTASLDPLQRKLFHALAAEAAQQRCLLVATHDIADLDEGLDSIVVLAAGAVRFCGSVGDFLAPARRTDDGSPVSAYAHWMQAA